MKPTPRQRRPFSALLACAAVVVLAAGSVAAGSASTPGSYCPAAAASAERGDGLPLGCPQRRGGPLSQALGFGAVALAAAWWAPRRRS